MQTLCVNTPSSRLTRMIGSMREKHFSLCVNGQEPDSVSIWRRKFSKDSHLSTYVCVGDQSFENMMKVIIGLYLYAKDKGYENNFRVGINNLKNSFDNNYSVIDLFVAYFKDVDIIQWKKTKQCIISANIGDLLSRMSIRVSGEAMNINDLIRIEKKRNGETPVDLANGLVCALHDSDNRIAELTDKDDKGFPYERHMTNLLICAHINDHNTATQYYLDKAVPFLMQENNRKALDNFCGDQNGISMDKEFKLDVQRETGVAPQLNIVLWLTQALLNDNQLKTAETVLCATAQLYHSIIKRTGSTYAITSMTRLLRNLEKSQQITITDNQLMPRFAKMLLNIDDSLPLSLQYNINAVLNKMINWRLSAISEQAPETTSDMLVAYYLDAIDFPEFEQERTSHPAYTALKALQSDTLDIYQAQKTLKLYTAEEALYAVTSENDLNSWVKYYKKTPSDALEFSTLSEHLRGTALRLMI